MITYTLEMPKPSTHVFEVTMNVDGVEKDSTLDVLLPVWRSGRYVILDFAGGIVAFNANDANKRKLDWSKIDKSTWRIETRGAANITIRYQVYANEFGMRTRGLNDDRAFVDGTAVFMYVKKYADLPVRLRVVPFGDWHVTTGLSPVRGERNTFSALNYEHLADCPLEIGTQKDYIFEVDGKEHVLSISGEGNFHPDTLIKDISRIINTQMEFWGSLPYDRYVFLLALSPSIGGGTEHLNSCVLCSHPFVFANPDSYRSFLGLISHEFFHTWNVKQLRPAAIDRYDWSRENYAKEFWIAEGTTSYYDDLLLARAGYLSEQKSLERVAEMINADVARPGNTRQSLTEASYDAWIKYGKEGQHAYNFETDYYGRGAAVSFALDMTIRKLTENRKSLDDVMRAMLAKFPRGRGGYTVADFQKISEEIAGASLKQFFDDYVDGVSPIPWDKLLAVVGLEREPKIAEQQPWLGLATVDEGQRTRVTNVVAGSPAYAAGVDINDEILALNGYRVRSADLRSRIAEMKDGEKVKLTVFRDSRLREFEIELKYPDYPDQKVVKTEPFADDKAAVFKSWIGLLDRVK
ncbi:MAG: M61 family metallopeptidase [Ignavibacteriae bacterium]|nr:M61 family metallopeptidase [Ignavibacteriota bacterium]